MNAGAAAAELPLERRFIDTRSAQKWWRICFGGSCGVRSIGDARQQLCTAASCLDAGKCCVAESSVWVLVLRPQSYSVSDADSAHVAPRNGDTPVLGADVMRKASGALGSSFALVASQSGAGKCCVTESVM